MIVRLEGFEVPSSEDCAAICEEVQICEGYTWFKDTPENGFEARKCYLKKNAFISKQRDGAAWSGVKDCHH